MRYLLVALLLAACSDNPAPDLDDPDAQVPGMADAPMEVDGPITPACTWEGYHRFVLHRTSDTCAGIVPDDFQVEVVVENGQVQEFSDANQNTFIAGRVRSENGVCIGDIFISGPTYGAHVRTTGTTPTATATVMRYGEVTGGVRCFIQFE